MDVPLFIVDNLDCDFHGVEIHVGANVAIEREPAASSMNEKLPTLEDNNSNDRKTEGTRTKLYVPSKMVFPYINTTENGENVCQILGVKASGILPYSGTTNTTVKNVYHVMSTDSGNPDEIILGETNWQEHLNGHYTFAVHESTNSSEFLHLICPSTVVENYTDKPEYININDILQPAVPDRSELNRTDAVDPSDMNDKENDDDVVFIKEYRVTPSVDASPNDDNVDSKSDNDLPVALTPTSTVIKHRRRRRNFGEKRKNPVRRAHIDKASADLIEKLSIPKSVFNAKIIKRRTNKTQVNDHRNVRQSCRTTGAILYPPIPLDQNDYKEWPVKGMHGRPTFNEEMGTMEHYNFGINIENERVERPVANIKETSSRNRYYAEANKFAQEMHKSMHSLLTYAEDLKIYNRYMDVLDPDEKERKCTSRFPLTDKENCRIAKQFQHIISDQKRCNKQNTLELAAILADTCTLYGLSTGIREKFIAEYITSLAVSEG